MEHALGLLALRLAELDRWNSRQSLCDELLGSKDVGELVARRWSHATRGLVTRPGTSSHVIA